MDRPKIREAPTSPSAASRGVVTLDLEDLKRNPSAASPAVVLELIARLEAAEQVQAEALRLLNEGAMFEMPDLVQAVKDTLVGLDGHRNAFLYLARGGGNKWTACSEQMPEEKTSVALRYPDGRIFGFGYSGGEFYRTGYMISPYPLAHDEAQLCSWFALPLPPEAT